MARFYPKGTGRIAAVDRVTPGLHRCLYFYKSRTIEIEGVKTTTDQLIRPAETPETRQAAPTELEDSLQLFFNEARRHPLLTAAEEVELAKRIERGDLAAKERMINAN